MKIDLKCLLTKFAYSFLVSILLLHIFASCKGGKDENAIGVAESVCIYGKMIAIKNDEVNAFLKDVDNIKPSDVKVYFSNYSTPQNVKMKEKFVLLTKGNIVSFKIENEDGATLKFNITVHVTLLGDELSHNGDLRIWIPLNSSDKNEAKEAFPDEGNPLRYCFTAPYNKEDGDLTQIWVLYKKEPASSIKSTDLRFVSVADGNEPLLLYENFATQGTSLSIPLYIDTTDGPKVYELQIKTDRAKDEENANIKSLTFNGKHGIIEGKNIRCDATFPPSSKVQVAVEMEAKGARYSVNNGENIIVKEDGASFSIVTIPKNTSGISKTYNVVLEAPANLAIKKVLSLNYDKNDTNVPTLAMLEDRGEIKTSEGKRYVTLPLYRADEDVAIHFDTDSSFEIQNVYFLKKNTWTRLDGYSSARGILTLREGVLFLPPSLSNELKLKVVFKNNCYDLLTIRFKKNDVLFPITLKALYLNDSEVANENIINYFNGNNPTFEAKGPYIYVDIVSKEALHARVENADYKSVYSGFFSYGLSLPIKMPNVGEAAYVKIDINCDYARTQKLQFHLKRLAGAVDLVLYPSINSQSVGKDLLDQFKGGNEPIVSISGSIMLFSIDVIQDIIDSATLNDTPFSKKTLTDSDTGNEFYRYEAKVEGLEMNELRAVRIEIVPKIKEDYNNLLWKFKVKRVN